MDIGLGSAPLSLDDRFIEHDRPVLLTGIQALLRVLLEQSRMDRAAGHNTAGLVSGYRGSPLGGLDQAMWKHAALMSAHDIRFQPGLNEDLAATILWGSQQLDLYPGKRVDGVFGMWYAKGPGVDRSGDALHAANFMGTHPLGGVLAVAGDDHAAHSSTYPHQTDHVFQGVMMPLLAPADVGEIIDLGLAGIALSRFSGLWVALKTIAETVEQAATTIVPSVRGFVRPDIIIPPHGLNIDTHLQMPAQRAELERRVIEERLPAALEFARANRLDRQVAGTAASPIGIVTVGKAHHDLMHALGMLGLRGDPRIAIHKVAMVWPLETESVRRFGLGRQALLVVEEKRSFVETQIRDALYNLPADQRPAIAGKADLAGAPLLPPVMEFSPELVADALARFLAPLGFDVHAPPARLVDRPSGLLSRAPAFCAGCPHATSTKVPEGSFATAGIGCHFLALGDGATQGFTQMGGEGAPWVGLAPFTDMKHIFINMGDGTFQHSGSLAIRQAVAAGADMTFKVLFNDAVAMTGGQPAEGGPTALSILAQVAAEGVTRIALVADDPARLPPAADLPAGVTRHGREDLDAVQRDFRDAKGVGVIVYDQVCATEKRRRRKRGKMATAERAVLISPEVCENCGDCSAQSHCIAIEPIETKLGRKRRISPTACNTDLSCMKGFCPSFVTVEATAAAPAPAASPWLAREAALVADLPEPALAPLPWRGLFAGIGGGGIVTTGAIVAMAAHLDGQAVTTLDFTGLSQKNGAVVSHVQIGEGLDVVRIPLGSADLMLAADLAVAAGPGVLERCRRDGAVIGNLDLLATADFARDPDLRVDAGLHRRAIGRACSGPSQYLRAAAVAERLFGNGQALNTLLLGLAWQAGLVPVSRQSLLASIELNGTAVAMNRRAFAWGRVLAAQPDLAAQILDDAAPPASLIELVETRATVLADYQDAAYAALYRSRVAAVADREAAVCGAPGPLALAAAEGWFRVMHVKDEYEVARLHAQAGYGTRPVFHLAPPLVTRIDPATGRRRKIAIPGWLALPAFRVLRLGRHLRGTRLDLFARQEDRVMERAMAAEYADDMARALASLTPATLAAAEELARWPAEVRGYGPVKQANRDRIQPRRDALLAALAARPVMLAAE